MFWFSRLFPECSHNLGVCSGQWFWHAVLPRSCGADIPVSSRLVLGTPRFPTSSVILSTRYVLALLFQKYCNTLLYGLAAVLINKVHRVLNAAARLVYRAPRHCHVTPLFARAALVTSQTEDSLQDFAFCVQDHPREITCLLARVNFTYEAWRV